MGRLLKSAAVLGRQFSQHFHPPKPATNTFKCQDLEVEKATQLKPKPDMTNLKFGHNFSDHMLLIRWTSEKGWHSPKIQPFQDLRIHPAAKVLHYATELFEGMKAYRGVDKKIRLFRPDLNMIRMRTTAARSCLPDFDGEELIKCISELIKLEQDWIPHTSTGSLYIRPTLIGTDRVLGVHHADEALLFVIVGPVGAYYPTGLKPVGLLADTQYTRAWPGGVGWTKAGSNYGPTLLIGKEAEQRGLQQALWLYGPEEKITEVGTMNIFVYWVNEKGEKELVTPPITDGLILPGVTRRTILDITKEWNEFPIVEKYLTMADLRKGLAEDRVLQMFGCGTACVVSPVDRIVYKHGDHVDELKIPTMKHNPSLMQRLFDAVTDLHYGRTTKPGWTRMVSI